jgi:hypothetical protein
MADIILPDPILVVQFSQMPSTVHSIGSNCNYSFTDYWSYIYNFRYFTNLSTIDGIILENTVAKNENNFGSFDIAPVMNNYFSFTENMQTTGFTGTNDFYAYKVGIKPNLGDDRTGYTYDNLHYVFNAKMPLSSSDIKDNYNNYKFMNYNSKSNTELYLNDDYTLRFFNNSYHGSASANTQRIYVDVIKEDGVINHYYLTNPYSGTTVNPTLIYSLNNNLLDVGVGPNNLNATPLIKYSETVNYVNYTLTPTTTYNTISENDQYSIYLASNSGTRMSDIKTFNVKCLKNRFEKPIQIAFKGLYGGIEYMSFVKNSEKKTSLNQSKYYRSETRVDSTNNQIVSNIKGGFNTFNSIQDQNYLIQSDWMLDEDSKRLEGIFYTDDIYVKFTDDNVWRKCILKDTEYITKTIARNRLFSLQLNITISNRNTILI